MNKWFHIIQISKLLQSKYRTTLHFYKSFIQQAICLPAIYITSIFSAVWYITAIHINDYIQNFSICIFIIHYLLNFVCIFLQLFYLHSYTLIDKSNFLHQYEVLIHSYPWYILYILVFQQKSCCKSELFQFSHIKSSSSSNLHNVFTLYQETRRQVDILCKYSLSQYKQHEFIVVVNKILIKLKFLCICSGIFILFIL